MGGHSAEIVAVLVVATPTSSVGVLEVSPKNSETLMAEAAAAGTAEGILRMGLVEALPSTGMAAGLVAAQPQPDSTSSSKVQQWEVWMEVEHASAAVEY